MSDYFCHESAYVDDGAQVGAGTRIWHFSHVMSGAKIGRNCVLGQNVNVGGRAEIGDGVKIQNNVSVYDRVIVEDEVFLGPSCVLTNVVNPRAFVERKSEYLETRIKRGATVGANATIVCGVTLGEYCLVGAGAVVTRDVPAYALVYGTPAKQHGWVSRAGVKLGDDLICPETGDRYQKQNGALAPEQAADRAVVSEPAAGPGPTSDARAAAHGQGTARK